MLGAAVLRIKVSLFRCALTILCLYKEKTMNGGELGRVCADGEIIFKEGEKGEVMYVIQSGRVRITKQTLDGDITIATLERGEIIGEMSLFDKLPRSATAIACGEARLLSIDKKKLFSNISRDPTLVFRILETMSQRIRKLNENLAKLEKDRVGILKLYVKVEDICCMVLEEAKNAVKADNGSVMILNDEKLLSVKAAFGEKSDHTVKLAVGYGIAGDVLKTGMAELINNVSMDPRFVHGTMPVKSLLCVPLKCRNDVFGVINMSNISERLFSLNDLKFLNSLSLYASIAIQNALNFSRLKTVADEVLMRVTMLNTVTI